LLKIQPLLRSFVVGWIWVEKSGVGKIVAEFVGGDVGGGRVFGGVERGGFEGGEGKEGLQVQQVEGLRKESGREVEQNSWGTQPTSWGRK